MMKYIRRFVIMSFILVCTIGVHTSFAVGEYKQDTGVFTNIHQWNSADSWDAVYIDGSNRISSLQSIVNNATHGYINHLNRVVSSAQEGAVNDYDFGGVGVLMRELQNGGLAKNKGKLFNLDNGVDVLINDNFIKWADEYVRHTVINTCVSSTLNVFKYKPRNNSVLTLDKLSNDGKVESLKNSLDVGFDYSLHPLLGKSTESGLNYGTHIQIEGTKVRTNASYVRAVTNGNKQDVYTGMMGTTESMNGGLGSVTVNGQSYTPVNVINTMYTLIVPNKLKYIQDQSLYTPLEDYRNSSVTLGESLHTSDNSIVCLELLSRKTFKANAEFDYQLLDKAGNFKVLTSHYLLTQGSYGVLKKDTDGKYQALQQGEERDTEKGIVVSQIGVQERVEYKTHVTGADNKKTAESKAAFTGRKVEFSGAPLQNPFNTTNGGMKIVNQNITVKPVAYAKGAAMGSDIVFETGFDETWGAYIKLPSGGIESSQLMEWLNGTEGKRLIQEMNPGVSVQDILNGINLAIKLSRGDLTYAEIARLDEIGNELELLKEQSFYKMIFVSLAVVGILMIFYSVVLVVAYFFDILGLFGEIQLLNIITFHGLIAVEDEEVKASGGAKGYVGKKGIFIRAGMCMLFGIIFLTGGQIYITMQKLFMYLTSFIGGVW